jgi:hypothetical protein
LEERFEDFMATDVTAQVDAPARRPTSGSLSRRHSAG